MTSMLVARAGAVAEAGDVDNLVRLARRGSGAGQDSFDARHRFARRPHFCAGLGARTGEGRLRFREVRLTQRLGRAPLTAVEDRHVRLQQ